MNFSARQNIASKDGRRASRLDLEFDAMLREPGTSKFQVRVKDLSVSGFRCETSFTLHEGSTVWLTINGLQALEARVAWREKSKYGFAFASPLHIAVFDHIARHIRATQGKASR